MKDAIIKGAVAACVAGACAIGGVAPAAAQAAAGEDPDVRYGARLLKPGTDAPEFALPTPAGDTVRLSDYRGRYVVVDFWASWCPDCVKDAPAVVRLHDAYAGRGVAFVGVSFDTSTEAWQKAIEKHGITYTQVSPMQKWKESDIAKAYCTDWIPTLYLISPEGKVVMGTVVSEKIDRRLKELLPAE